MSANEIIPNLFLGDITSSQSKDFYKQVGIGMVVNCSKNIPFLEEPHLHFKRVRLPVDDNLQDEEIENMYKWSFKTIRTIWDAYKTHTPILVHCHAGMQRSAAIVAMFLIFFHRCSHTEAIQRIQQRRAIAFQPRPNFYKAILRFEKDINETIRRTLD